MSDHLIPVASAWALAASGAVIGLFIRAARMEERITRMRDEQDSVLRELMDLLRGGRS